MRLIIGEYHEGKLQPGYHASGDDVPAHVLQELKGRFAKDYRDANIQLTEAQLLAAATPDQDIIQAVHALENLDVVLNSMGKYSTEWYELHHPDREVVWDELVKEDLTEPGLSTYNKSIASVLETRETLIAYLEERMRAAMPNTTVIAGSLIGAKLLAAAGSLERLSRFPATTVQLLGAEQALFRHLRNRGVPPPKHGILINHPLVQTAGQRRGKMARALANAISIASKVDYYKGEPIGEQLRVKLEGQHRALTRA